jgi:hypothetical protein
MVRDIAKEACHQAKAADKRARANEVKIEAICRQYINNPTRYQDMSEVTTNAEIVTRGAPK